MNNHVPHSRMLSSRERPAFSFHHVVSFEDTNVVGNVYFARHVAWQGRCRELFLRTHAPEILQELSRDLRLATLRVSCEYFEELRAFDEIEIRMSLAHLHAHRIGLNFEYAIARGENCTHTIVASGFQEIACMRLTENGLVATEPPRALMTALEPYSSIMQER